LAVVVRRSSATERHGRMLKCGSWRDVAWRDTWRVLTRGRPDNPNDYVICVVYKGKPTHHLVAGTPGNFTVNKVRFVF
jgi:hypothetical protein